MVKTTPGAIVSSKVYHHYMPFLVAILLLRFMALEKSLGYQRFRRKEYLNALRLLEESLKVGDSVFNTIERLVCHLYGIQTEHGIKNRLYKKFNQGKTPDPQQLPLTHDELQQHVKRYNY